MSAVSSIKGIQFFDSRKACLKNWQEKPWHEKVLSCIRSYGTWLSFTFDRLSLKLRNVEAKTSPHISPTREFSKNKLVICIHGLNGSPNQFNQVLNNLNDTTAFDLYCPKVINEGNIGLDDAVKPIFEKISKWAAKEGDKELVLVGISNGSRIARAIETELIKEKKYGQIKKIRFVSIVGANKGSSLATLGKKLNLLWVMSKPIAKEMPLGSERNQRLTREWADGVFENHNVAREYTFIASPHDWLVPNKSSSLYYGAEMLEFPVRYTLIPGHGHCSLVKEASQAIAEIIVN